MGSVAEIEDMIVHRAIDALLAPNRAISLWSGSAWSVRHCHDSRAIAAAIRHGTEERIFVEGGGRQLGWVRLIYGRDGWNVIDGWSTELSDMIRPVIRYANIIRDHHQALTATAPPA